MSEAPKSPKPKKAPLSDVWVVLRDCPDYRRLYLARNASLLGDWFNLLAVFALLRELGAMDAGVVGTVIILKLLPVTIAGPAAGVIADRFSRKAILLIADGSRFFLVLAMFLTPLLGKAGIPLLYALTFLQITAQAFSEPARIATIPNVVPERLLGAANAIGALTWSLMFTLGAALGGLVTSQLGWKLALGLDASTYVVSFLILLRAHVPRPRRRPAKPDLLTFLGVRDFIDVGRFIKARPRIAGVMSAKTGWSVAGAIGMMLALFGERVYPVAGSADLGIALLYMARGIGTAVGPVIARRLTHEEPRALRHAISVSFVLAAVCYIAFAGVSNIGLAVGLVVIAHFGGSTIWVFSTVLLQKAVPDEYRGRVFAAELGMATAMISLTTWSAGAALDLGWLGLRPLSATMGAGLLVVAVLWMWMARRLRLGEADPTGDAPPLQPLRSERG